MKTMITIHHWSSSEHHAREEVVCALFSGHLINTREGSPVTPGLGGEYLMSLCSGFMPQQRSPRCWSTEGLGRSCPTNSRKKMKTS